MTTRRNFIRNVLVAGASFTILPSAGRIWRAKRAPVAVIQIAPGVWSTKEIMDQIAKILEIAERQLVLESQCFK